MLYIIGLFGYGWRETVVSTGPASTTQCHVGIPSFFCLLAHFFWITVFNSKLSVCCMLKKGNIYLWISWLTGLFSIIKEIINSTRMALLSAVIQLTHSSVKGSVHSRFCTCFACECTDSTWWTQWITHPSFQRPMKMWRSLCSWDQPDLMLNIFQIIGIILVSTESR